MSYKDRLKKEKYLLNNYIDFNLLHKTVQELSGNIIKDKLLLKNVGINSLISENTKTIQSINMPIITCNPSPICAKHCYACLGPISWNNSIKKSLLLNEIFNEALKQNKIIEMSALIYNNMKKNIPLRWNGSGDLTEATVDIIDMLSTYDIKQYVFSRHPLLAKKLTNLTNVKLNISIDKTSNIEKIKEIMGNTKYSLTYLRCDNIVTNDNAIDIIFPLKRQYKDIPEHIKDCPCDRGQHITCLECMKCL